MKTSLNQLLTLCIDEVNNSLINGRPLNKTFKDKTLLRALKEARSFCRKYEEQNAVTLEVGNENKEA